MLIFPRRLAVLAVELLQLLLRLLVGQINLIQVALRDLGDPAGQGVLVPGDDGPDDRLTVGGRRAPKRDVQDIRRRAGPGLHPADVQSGRDVSDKVSADRGLLEVRLLQVLARQGEDLGAADQGLVGRQEVLDERGPRVGRPGRGQGIGPSLLHVELGRRLVHAVPPQVVQVPEPQADHGPQHQVRLAAPQDGEQPGPRRGRGWLGVFRQVVGHGSCALRASVETKAEVSRLPLHTI